MASLTRKQKAAIAAACTLAAGTLTIPFEGIITHPNPDPSNPHLLQVCAGDTEVEMRTYSIEECAALLERRQEGDYAPVVLRCAPGLVDKREAFAASIDAAYNAGTSAFCRSPMARRFNAGDLSGGCNQFITLGKDGKPIAGWYYGTVSTGPVRGAWYSFKIKSGPNAGKYYNVFRGLVRRRAAERALCLKAVH